MIIKITRELNGKVENKCIDEKDLGFFALKGWRKKTELSETHTVKKGRKRED